MKNVKELISSSRLPARDATIVMAHILHQDKSYVLAHQDDMPTLFEHIRWYWGSNQLRHGWSVAHTTGHKEFFGLDFLVNRHTLIPRPDTEIMVETVLEILNQNTKQTAVLDIGTGSGCIAIALAKNNPLPLYYGSDISHRALRIAKANAKYNQVTIDWRYGNLLTPFWSELFWGEPTASIIITANLPYLTPEQLAGEPNIQKEPVTALVSGIDGLDAYRALLTQLQQLHSPAAVTVLMEIDPSQVSGIGKVLSELLPAWTVITKADLQGRSRLVIISNR